ncbi:MAG TPA: tRNA lysidine(34) synthetase TilS, partial [Chloroflexia bacterium]|nr:tRNA lysidine(34) synthetase TilS [Chloroflexia bacterium]
MTHNEQAASRSKDDLARKVLEAVQREGLEHLLLTEPLVVAVSGGADSLVLLHVLTGLRGVEGRQTLHVAHLNHGLRGADAEEDAQFVASVAKALGLQYTIGAVDAPALARDSKIGFEEAARILRYRFLTSVAAKHNTAIAVAHTADDQAETVLMNIIRGSGLHGLAGMKMLVNLPHQTLRNSTEQGTTSEIDRPNLFRPLLGIWRREIEQYAAAHNLSVRTDASNLDLTYKRNRLRGELLPLLEASYNSGIKRHLWDLSQIAGGEDEMLDNLAEDALRRVAAEEQASSVSCVPFASLPEPLQLRVTRLALRNAAGTLEGFDSGHIRQASQVLVGASPGCDLPHALRVECTGDTARITLRGGETHESHLLDSSRWPVASPRVAARLTPGETVGLGCGWQVRCR